MLSRLTAAARSERGLFWIGVIDALILGLAILAIAIFLTGGFVFHAAGLRISLKSEARALVGAAVLLALRHGLRPSPALWTLEAFRHARTRTRAAVPRLASHALAAIWPVVLTTRFAVLIAGFVAVTSFGYPDGNAPRNSADELVNLPFRWDACWYINIATAGYHHSGDVGAQQNLNFFPAMPMAVRAVSSIIEGPRPGAVMASWVGTFLAIIAFLAAMVYVYRLAQPQLGDEVALRSVMLISGLPVLESSSACRTPSRSSCSRAPARSITAGRTSRFARCCGDCRRPLPPERSRAGGAARLHVRRPQSHRFRQEGRPAHEWRRSLLVGAVVASGPIIGLLIYSAAVWQMTGHPFFWADLQREAWGRTFHGPADIFRFPADVIRAFGVTGFIERRPIDAFHALVAALALISIVPVTRRLGVAAGLFQAGSVLLPLMNGGLTSFGRFSGVQFPGFIWLASVLPARWYAPTLILFGLGQAMAAAFFFTWRPLF